MIKFFRKIRQRLLTENKFSKYLLYAIGEIVLVVIGILIALQINNWNNDRIERHSEASALNEILGNLERDVEMLNKTKGWNNLWIRNNQKVLNHLEERSAMTDSLRWYYHFLKGGAQFQPILVGYENLKSKGIDIIRNDSLRMAISELYDHRYHHLVKNLRSHHRPIKEFQIAQVINNISTVGERSAEPNDLNALYDNLQFKESRRQTIFSLKWMNGHYDIGIEQNEEVQQKIRRELDHPIK